MEKKHSPDSPKNLETWADEGLDRREFIKRQLKSALAVTAGAAGLLTIEAIAEEDNSATTNTNAVRKDFFIFVSSMSSVFCLHRNSIHQI